MKKIILIVICFSLAVTLYSYDKMRYITTVDGIIYNDGTYFFEWEEVALTPVSESLLINIRISADVTKYWQRFLLQGGVVYVWAPGLYSEAVYGPAMDDEGTLSHEGYAETTFEKERYTLSARLKLGSYPDDDLWFLLPDVGGSYLFTPFYTLKGKYYFGIDSDMVLNNSLQLENRFTLNERLRLDLIMTGGVESADSERTFSHEIGLKGQLTIKKNMNLRYFTNYLNEGDNLLGWENTLTFDISF
ncbi:MAG: hypothetical protein PQJ60_12155 [Spirochaetales bacterium]|nr:hypothetical protein [Spirochaetales bacterium]